MSTRQSVAAEPIPRTVWMLWLQGLDAAPPVVHRCHASWVRRNPGWNVVLLDEQTARDHLDIEPVCRRNNKYITPQGRSNIIRLNLLAKYGGVWADATCFCCTPLDHWIDDAARSGFFAFDRPNRDRLLSTWLMAASSDCHLIRGFCELHDTFFRDNDLSGLRRRWITKRLTKLFDHNVATTRLWFTRPVRWFKTRPYFVCHYLFAELLHRDPTSRAIWAATPKVSADIPHTVLFSLLDPLTDALRRHIDERESPAYKLTWKFDESRFQPGCVLDYLFQRYADDMEALTGVKSASTIEPKPTLARSIALQTSK